MLPTELQEAVIHDFAEPLLTTGELVYVNGGHNPPLVQANGKDAEQSDDVTMLGLKFCGRKD